MTRILFAFLVTLLAQAAIGQQFTLSGNGLHNWCTGENPSASECYVIDECPDCDSADRAEEEYETQNCLDLIAKEQSQAKALCKGYLQAAHDLGKAQGTVCTLTEVGLSDMSSIYVLLAPTLFATEPAIKNKDAITVAVSVLSRAFPCE